MSLLEEGRKALKKLSNEEAVEFRKSALKAIGSMVLLSLSAAWYGSNMFDAGRHTGRFEWLHSFSKAIDEIVEEDIDEN